MTQLGLKKGVGAGTKIANGLFWIFFFYMQLTKTELIKISNASSKCVIILRLKGKIGHNRAVTCFSPVDF